MPIKKYREVHAADLTGNEETFYFCEEKGDRNKFQTMARDERSTEEIINEGEEIPTFKSQIYPYHFE